MSSFVFSSSFLLALFASVVAVDFKHPETCSKVEFVKVDVLKEFAGVWYVFMYTYESGQEGNYCAMINVTYTKNQTGLYEKGDSKTRLKSGEVVEQTHEKIYPASFDGLFRNVTNNGNNLLTYGFIHKGRTYYIGYYGNQYYADCQEMVMLITRDVNVPSEAIEKIKKYAEDMKLKLTDQREVCKGLY